MAVGIWSRGPGQQVPHLISRYLTKKVTTIVTASLRSHIDDTSMTKRIAESDLAETSETVQFGANRDWKAIKWYNTTTFCIINEECYRKVDEYTGPNHG